MKWLLIFMLCVAHSLGLCGTAEFIQKNKIQMTPSQIEEYNHRIYQDRPDSTYNPMHVGDKWWFQVEEGSDTNIYKMREVIDSMTIDGYTYFKMWGAGLGTDYWIRNEGDTILVYDQYDTDNNPNTHDLVNNDFTMTTPGLCYPISYDGNLDLCNCFPGIIYQATIFNIPTVFLEMTYHYAPIIDSWTTWCWARNFGVAGFVSEGCEGSLYACLIGGVFYGDSTVVNTDNVITANNSIETYSYPNPFCRQTQIIYQLPKSNQTGVIEIYNTKGQRCIRKTIQNSGCFTWNGVDNNNHRLSTGVYYYVIKTNTHHSVLKKMVFYE